MTDSGTSKNNASNDIPASSSTGNKLFSMKLFSSWDGEKSAPNCIPRLCTLTITRLVIKKPLETESNSVIIAIKMRGSKRILRSNEIAVQKNGLVDSELDLLFSLQYPHHLKRDGNRLQIMLQRRKKYKNRTILGFKTLAAGHINMSEVLQHSIDQELNLHSPSKDGKSEAVAIVAIMSLSSQPVDQDDLRTHHSMGKERYANYDTWDDEEMQDDGDISSNDGLSDFEAMDDHNHPTRPRNKSTFGNAFVSQQKNLKQKFIKLIRKFKVSDEVLESAVQEIGVHDRRHYADDDLFDDVESLSDSNPDVDAISLQSVPKPKLKPFFDANHSINSIEIQKPHLENAQQFASDNMASSTLTTTTSSAASSSKKQDSKADKKGEKNISDLFGKKNSDKTNAELSSKKEKNVDNLGNVGGSGSTTTGGDKKSSEKQFPNLFSGNKKYEKNVSMENSKKTAEAKTFVDTSSISQKKLSTVVLDSGAGGSGRKVEKPMCYDLKINESDAFQVKLFQDQIASLSCTDLALPNCVIFMNYQEPCCLSLKQKLDEKKMMNVCTSTHADVKTALNAVVNRIQKFMNTSSLLIKLVILGGEGYLHSIVRPFVKVVSSRSPDIINHVRFLVVPLGYSFFCQNLAQMDSRYAKLFNDTYWKELTVDKIGTESDLTEVTDRLMTYIREASFVVQIPFSEVVLTNKDKGPDDSSQMVVPFLGEIRLKPIDMGSDVDDAISTSPPQSTFLDKLKEVTSHTLQGPPYTSQQQNVISVVNVTVPPTSQSTSTSATTTSTTTNQAVTTEQVSIITATNQPTTAQPGPAPTTSSDEMELQMDYWMVPKLDGVSGNVSEKNLKKDSKCSLKNSFKSVQIFRPGLISTPQIPQYTQQQLHESPPSSNTSANITGLSMIYVTRDKKQKIMRIGKKSRDDGLKSQQIDGISRLICTSKDQSHHLTVNIDGMDWMGIKFFQVSTHWQTHCKHFPVLVFGGSVTDISLNN